MDIKKLSNKTLIMDGAHNEQKMLAFVQSFQSLFPSKKAVIVLSLKQDKDYRVVVDALVPIAAEVITTTFETSQELPVVSMDPEVLATYCRECGITKTRAMQNHHEAYEAMRQSSEPLAIITGSFYLIYQMRSEEHLT